MPDVEISGRPQRARLASSRSRRSPPWECDELILALDLYLRRGQPSTSDPEIVALSEVLNRLPVHPPGSGGATFRSPNSVHMKLAYFQGPDPSYSGRGLQAGGRRVQEIWDRFADDPDALAVAVSRIIAAADREDTALPDADEDESAAIEGRILFREHRARERSPALTRRKKADVLRRHGRLSCEVCDVDFGERYGEIGEGFIECHHTLPLAAAGRRTTTIADLALVCPNCHRMLHRSRRQLTVVQLRRALDSTTPP